MIERQTLEGGQAGIQFDSVVNCVNLVTLDKKKVLCKIGSLTQPLMQQVGDALKTALQLP